MGYSALINITPVHNGFHLLIASTCKIVHKSPTDLCKTRCKTPSGAGFCTPFAIPSATGQE